MSIASRIASITGHITDIYDTLELGGDTTSNKNIVNINTEIKREYKDFLANGTDTLWNNWEKVSGTGETLSLSPTIKGKMKVELKGNTQQNGTPTPDSPIPVQVVSGDNSITICGKNIFDEQFEDGGINNNTGQKETATGFIRTKNYTQIEPNTTYYRTPTIESTRIFFYDKNYNYLSNVYLASYGSTFTTPSNAKYLSFKIYISTYNNDIAIIKGNSGTYTPYVSQTYPISLGNIELCKIGTHQDSIVKDNGKWYLNKQIGKVVLNGSEDGWALDLTGTNTYRFRIDENTLANAQSGFCNNNQWVISGFSGDNQLIGKLNNKLYYRINKSIVDVQTGNTIVNQFKTWLSNNNIICYSPLATPTDTPITDTTLLPQLDNFYNANSYEGTTNVSQVNDDMPFILDLTCLKEI